MNKENKDLKAACQLICIICVCIILLCISPLLFGLILILSSIVVPVVRWILNA